jgi:hypothetical protein
MFELDGDVEGIDPWDFFPWPQSSHQPVWLMFDKTVLCMWRLQIPYTFSRFQGLFGDQ